MALTITFFSCRLFLYCSYNMWRLMHCRDIVSEFWLFVDFFRYTKHLHLVAPLVPKSVTSYSIWPLASYLFRWFLPSQPFFTCNAYCIVHPCYVFLSVLRLSVSRSLVKCVLGVAPSLCGSWASCIMKLFSRLFILCCRNCPKDDKFRYFIPILRKLGAA